MTRYSCCIVANFNGHGLSKDAEILETFLNTNGFRCTRKSRRDLPWFGSIFAFRRYDLVIYLETIYLRWLFVGRKTCLIPNQEWFKPKKIWSLNFVDLVLCKSSYAQNIFCEFVGSKAKYIGFASPVTKGFHERAVLKDFGKWLHIAGGSQSKGTESLLNVWRDLADPPELTIVQRAGNAPQADTLPSSVTLITDYLDDEELHLLRVKSGVHVCPSEAEGFGHNIYQGMAVGSVVITTNFPPMNELISNDRGFLVDIKRLTSRRLGHTAICDEKILRAVIEKVSRLERTEATFLGSKAQSYAEFMLRDFERRFLRYIFGLVDTYHDGTF